MRESIPGVPLASLGRRPSLRYAGVASLPPDYDVIDPDKFAADEDDEDIDDIHERPTLVP